MEYAQGWFKGDLNLINFQYIPKPKYWHKLKEKNINPEEVKEKLSSERASLSWHLTTREKESIERTIFENNNQAALINLKALLEIE